METFPLMLRALCALFGNIGAPDLLDPPFLPWIQFVDDIKTSCLQRSFVFINLINLGPSGSKSLPQPIMTSVWILVVFTSLSFSLFSYLFYLSSSPPTLFSASLFAKLNLGCWSITSILLLSVLTSLISFLILG